MIKEDTKTLLKFNAEGIHPGEMFFNARQEAIRQLMPMLKNMVSQCIVVLPMFQYILQGADLLLL